jgi:hypothetical protein
VSRLTWSRNPRETGRVSAGPRGWTLKADGVRVGSVSIAYEGFSRDVEGWYFAARGADIALNNSAARGVFYPDAEEAKAACKAYVVACLKAKEAPE